MNPPRTTTFTIVAPPRPRRKARRWVAVLLALVAVAGVAAAAGALTVGIREEAAAVFAERIEIGDRFEIVDATIAVVPASAGALGVAASPVELTVSPGDARTALARDHWSYTVTIRESSTTAVAAGTYVITAFADGVRLGAVYARQGTADAGAVEGVRATFDVGTQLQPSSLYYVVVELLQETLPSVTYVVQSNPNDNLTWLGVSDGIAGQANPRLTVAAGTILHLTGRNGDDALHNIGITTTGGQVLDPPDWSLPFRNEGDEQTISWTAVAGTYRYQCEYHASMRGDIVVA